MLDVMQDARLDVLVEVSVRHVAVLPIQMTAILLAGSETELMLEAW